jgi:hypothetical protein
VLRKRRLRRGDDRYNVRHRVLRRGVCLRRLFGYFIRVRGGGVVKLRHLGDSSAILSNLLNL